MKLSYITYKNIDKEKWDTCIRNAANGLIYAESVYLDHMAAHWDAIIMNDYDAVMPLTWKKKLGIRYLYQPCFIQQGGIFSKDTITEELLESFMDLASQKIKFAEITLNFLNVPQKTSHLYDCSLRNNFILPLGNGYTLVADQYKIYIKQRLKRLMKFSLQYHHTDQYSEVISLYKELYQERLPAFSDKDYARFTDLCHHYARNNRLISRQVFNKEGTSLLASALMLKDKKRIYNIISCILPEGKKQLANYFIYDQIIREHADQHILLDFEGSDVPGIAYFYQKFSAHNQQYPFIRYNLLPAPIRLLKP